MSEILLQPKAIFSRLATDLPADLHDQVFVIGSLAAACHYVDRLVRGGVKTKDADLVVHPSDNTEGAQSIAQRLLDLGWRHRNEGDFRPGTADTPASALPAIRLYPPGHREYFVELLIVPEGEHPGAKPWLHVQMEDGWYGLPSFEFLALTQVGRLRFEGGLSYAHPSMMALANLLSHRVLVPHKMSTPIEGRTIERYAKDLGRVLALAHLEPRSEIESWAERWLDALRVTYPHRWPELASTVGSGLRELLTRPTFEEAHYCCVVGLLSGQGVSEENLRATAERFLIDAVEPVEEAGRQSARQE